ncbi:MAG: helix-turn-helix transcriptional regulator [Clostridia bacterium]|nr:helix-turn-helix transcriptional regulator [Clostridia bacterium]
MDNKEIGGRIKKYREERGWKQYTLAIEAGVAASYIPDLESGKKCPTVQTLEQICYAFNISLSEFFADDERIINESPIEGLSVAESELVHYFRKLPSTKQRAIITLIENK